MNESLTTPGTRADPPARRRGLALVAAISLAFPMAVLFAPDLLPALLLAIPIGYVLARSRRDAGSVLIVFVVLLIAIPARLVFQPMGASGVPSIIFGLLLLFIWTQGKVLPSLGLARSRQPVRVGVAIVLVSVMASYVAATMRVLPAVELDALDRGVIFIASLCGIALFAADGVTDRARLDSVLRWLAVMGALLGMLAMVQYTFGWDPMSNLRIPGLSADRTLNAVRGRIAVRRVLGTAKHPIELGVVLAMIFPIALHYADQSWRRYRSIVPWVGVGAILLAIPMSVSRSGIVALVTAVFVLFPTWSPERRRNAIPLVFLGAIGARLLFPGLLGTIRGLFLNFSDDPSVEARTADYERAWRFIGEAPLFGRGFKTFDPERYILLDNQYLLSMIETGLFGLFALLLLFVIGMSLARGARRRSTDPVTRDLGQSLAASIAAGSVGFVTFDALVYPMTTGLLFLLIGLAGALWRLQGGPSSAVPTRRIREFSA